MISIKNALLFGLVLLFFSCQKEEIENDSNTIQFKNGLLVLNEGLFHQNNSSLDWIDLDTKKIQKSVFESVNGRHLGDTGNDLLVYGGKIYITTTTSSTVEIIDRNSLKSIKQLPFNFNNQTQQPRYFAKDKGKVFVTSYDGYVSVIDTSSLTIQKRIKVGRNPEGICVSNQAIYVANSGGLDFNNMDSTVMRIDLNTLAVTDTFVVGQNPGRMVADAYNHVYVVKQGDYGNDPSELVRLNTENYSIENLGIPATALAIKGDELYTSHYDFNSGSSFVSIYNCKDGNISNTNFINSQEITTLYGVYPILNGQTICLDAMNFTNSGYLRFFDASGGLVNSLNVGLNPCLIVEL